tara:strand:- start:3716 stop:4063 length:348 start_codon:yes stop_codon:yes gene_type:complete
VDSNQKKAFERRQKDTGWLYAIGHGFPPYLHLIMWVYYAITRRTITPLLYSLIFSVIAFVVSVFIQSAIGGEDYYGAVRGGSLILTHILTAIIAKQGINKARISAKNKLKASEEV